MSCISHRPETATTASRMNRLVPLVALCAGVFAATSGAAPVSPDELNDMSLVGSARKVDKAVRLIPPVNWHAGAAWRETPISLLESFHASFRFRLAAGSRPHQADGIGLVIQTDGPGAIGDAGFGIGYYGLNGVASVVTTWDNNRAGLSLDGNPFDAKRAPADLGAAAVVEGGEVVTYDAVNHVLTMRGRLSVDGVEYAIHDRADVDLAALLGSDTATIGFTGASGAANADERVSEFRFYLD